MTLPEILAGLRTLRGDLPCGSFLRLGPYQIDRMGARSIYSFGSQLYSVARLEVLIGAVVRFDYLWPDGSWRASPVMCTDPPEPGGYYRTLAEAVGRLAAVVRDEMGDQT